MDEETLMALEESIQHWERNAECEDPENLEIGPRSCALCARFWFLDREMQTRKLDGQRCIGCPVYERTGQWDCRGSPYEELEGNIGEWPAERVKAQAKAELEFLQSLLPEREGER